MERHEKIAARPTVRGIGLAVVKELVEARGGRAGVEISQLETFFGFTLPVDYTDTSRNL